ncbi:hypothetical protein GWK90_07025 [Candidatus Hamiltonella defensa]|uniref:Uncharacterized protein n=1 Tax=Candidatus Williamhamiltonella defendens TaxID=138072 RepID=A0AAC9VJU9_9ENTR|nr:hypothetical protein [Candidatus Hamiltonella defensa]ASV33412.1 hypothetical protein CJJ18_04395 [Candidatus Hamiltonella defensa]AWK16357.1 hypothetical protein CCS40_04245 [Candidatus Hamiltonella defensa]MBK4361979.1 hypothetical protein [Candidatus Hamiltonella defensa]
MVDHFKKSQDTNSKLPEKTENYVIFESERTKDSQKTISTGYLINFRGKNEDAIAIHSREGLFTLRRHENCIGMNAKQFVAYLKSHSNVEQEINKAAGTRKPLHLIACNMNDETAIELANRLNRCINIYSSPGHVLSIGEGEDFMKLSEKRNKIFTRKIGNEDLRSITVAKPRMIFPQKNEVQKYIEEEKRDIESKKSITGPGYINNSYREYVRTASDSHPSTSSAIDIPSTSTKTPISNTAAATSAAEKRASISSTSNDKIPITTKLFIRAVVAELEEPELYEEKNKWQKITKTEEITPLCENILKILENDPINHQKIEQATRRAVKNLRKHLKYSVTPESISKETNQAVSTAVVKKTTKTPSKTTLSNCYAASAILPAESLKPHQSVAQSDVSEAIPLHSRLQALKKGGVRIHVDYANQLSKIMFETSQNSEEFKRMCYDKDFVKECVLVAKVPLHGSVSKDKRLYYTPFNRACYTVSQLAQSGELPTQGYEAWIEQAEKYDTSPTALIQQNMGNKDFETFSFLTIAANAPFQSLKLGFDNYESFSKHF